MDETDPVKWLSLELTNLCNFRCPGCPTPSTKRPRGFMSPEMFEDILMQLKNGPPYFRYTTIRLNGLGEPLLSPHFMTALDALDRRGFRNVDLNTNAVLLTKEVSQQLIQHRCVTSVEPTIATARRTLFEQIRSTGENLDLSIRNFRQLLDMNPPFSVYLHRFITTANTDETNEEMYALVGRKDFTITTGKYCDVCKTVPITPLMFPVSYARYCGTYASNALVIHRDGDIVGCCFDDSKTQVAGNVRDGIFSEAVQARIREFRRYLKDGDYTHLPVCRRCLS